MLGAVLDWKLRSSGRVVQVEPTVRIGQTRVIGFGAGFCTVSANRLLRVKGSWPFTRLILCFLGINFRQWRYAIDP